MGIPPERKKPVKQHLAVSLDIESSRFNYLFILFIMNVVLNVYIAVNVFRIRSF